MPYSCTYLILNCELLIFYLYLQNYLYNVFLTVQNKLCKHNNSWLLPVPPQAGYVPKILLYAPPQAGYVPNGGAIYVIISLKSQL